jgi:NAD(P)-dependent dehydrogenase (short-subunit alcohol dehydrogenase family)
VKTPTPIEGSVTLVTGAASGIGKAVSTALAGRGARVVMSDIDRAALDDAAAGSDGIIDTVTLDVRDPDAFAATVDRITADYGRLDILINNAGTAVVGEAQELRLEHWQRVLEVNLHGVVNGVLAAYPGMVTNGAGHIVNVSSLAGLVPAPLFTAYSASKFAVVGLGLSLRAEAATHGVKVTTVCPGAIETPLLDMPSPRDMAALATAPDVRAFLTRDLGPPYAAASMARDIVRAMERNRAILVAPSRARLAGRASRLFPRATLGYATHSIRRHQKNQASP